MNNNSSWLPLKLKKTNPSLGISTSPKQHSITAWIKDLRSRDRPLTKGQDQDASFLKEGHFEKIRASKENHEYQIYMSEVRALNTVKEFLAENKETLSAAHKQSLI